MVEDAIKLYDNEESKESNRTDFLALFRKEGEKSPDKMPHQDLMNHLMNNLYAFHFDKNRANMLKTLGLLVAILRESP